MKKRLRKKFENYLKECCLNTESSFTDEDYKEIICGVCNTNIYKKCYARSIFDCPKGIKGILKNEKKEYGIKTYKEIIKLKELKKHKAYCEIALSYEKRGMELIDRNVISDILKRGGNNE